MKVQYRKHFPGLFIRENQKAKKKNERIFERGSYVSKHLQGQIGWLMVHDQ